MIETMADCVVIRAPVRCRDKKSLRVIETMADCVVIRAPVRCRDKKSLRVIETLGVLVRSWPNFGVAEIKKSLRVIET